MCALHTHTHTHPHIHAYIRTTNTHTHIHTHAQRTHTYTHTWSGSKLLHIRPPLLQPRLLMMLLCCRPMKLREWAERWMDLEGRRRSRPVEWQMLRACVCVCVCVRACVRVCVCKCVADALCVW